MLSFTPRRRPSPFTTASVSAHPAWRGWAVFVCVLAILWAQGVVQFHRVLHAHGPAAIEGAASPKAAPSALNGLWGEHGQSSDCQQFDQTVPDGIGQAAALLASAPMALPEPSTTAITRLASPERFYASRAPPLFLS